MMLCPKFAARTAAVAGFALTQGLMALPGHAGIDAVPLPSYEQGQTFIFTNRRVERFVSTEGTRLTWASRSGRIYVRSADFTEPNLFWESDDLILRRHVSGNVNGLWPLAPGRSSRYSVTAEKQRKGNRHASRSLRHWACKVRRLQMVHVRAGEFSVYPIVCTRYSANSMRVIRKVKWDYAPAVGHYVKRTVTNFRTGRTESFELAVSLPPEQANGKRIRSILKTLRKD